MEVGEVLVVWAQVLMPSVVVGHLSGFVWDPMEAALVQLEAVWEQLEAALVQLEVV